MSYIPAINENYDSESSSSDSGEENSTKLTKSDKALILDTIIAQKFLDQPLTEKSEYCCVHSCHICDDLTKTAISLPSASNFQENENDFSFSARKRKLIIESLVHGHFKDLWKIQRERLRDINRRLNLIMEEMKANSTANESATNPENITSRSIVRARQSASGEGKGIRQVDDSQKKLETIDTTIYSSHNTVMAVDGHLKTVEAREDDKTILHTLRDIVPSPRQRTAYESKELSVRSAMENCSESQRKMIETEQSHGLSHNSVVNTERDLRKDEITRPKRRLKMDQDHVPEKKRKIVELIPPELKKTQASTLTHAKHQTTMYQQYGPLGMKSYPHNKAVVNSCFRRQMHVVKRTKEFQPVAQTPNAYNRPLVLAPRSKEKQGLNSMVKKELNDEPKIATSSFPAKNVNKDSPSLVMNSKHDVFYIDRKYVNVDMYWKGLQKEGWNPTQCVYEICSECYWGCPIYTQIDYVEMQGYIFALEVKNRTFLPESRVVKRKEAKHLASVEFLKYLGFDFDYNPQIRPLNDLPYQHYDNYHRPR